MYRSELLLVSLNYMIFSKIAIVQQKSVPYAMFSASSQLSRDGAACVRPCVMPHQRWQHHSSHESFLQNFHILTHTNSANFLVALLGGKCNTCYEIATSLSSCNRLRPFDNLIELIFKKKINMLVFDMFFKINLNINLLQMNAIPKCATVQ